MSADFPGSHIEQNQLLNEIIFERQRQLEKWGVQHHSIDFWLGITLEEFGEVAKGIIERKPEDVRKEVIHTMACLISILEATNEEWQT